MNQAVNPASDRPDLDVLTVGEAMALLMACEPVPLEQVGRFERATAGAELNVSVGLARLGFQAGYISRLGMDSFGRHLRAFMAAEGIDLRHVQEDARYPTGFMLKSMALDGSDPQIEYFRRGSAASHMALHELPAGVVREARLLHLTGISPALSSNCLDLVFGLAAQARSAGRLVSFDPNLRPRLWPSQDTMVTTLNELAAQADLVLPGLAEGRLLSGCEHAEGIADFYLARGASQVVVKLGPEGAYYASANERGIAPGRRVERVVDTVGAGDGFAVGVISALLDGLPLGAAAARGNAIGARVVQFRGDCEGLPSRAQLDAA
jgi:2-dehydro-3-deoxygluconokinase